MNTLLRLMKMREYSPAYCTMGKYTISLPESASPESLVSFSRREFHRVIPVSPGYADTRYGDLPDGQRELTYFPRNTDACRFGAMRLKFDHTSGDPPICPNDI
jgi:hypothetical protein